MLCAQVGSVMVAEAIKLITGVGESLLGRVLVLDSLAMRWQEIRLRPDPGVEPVTALLEDYAAFCGMPRQAGSVPEVSATALAGMLVARAAGHQDFLPVDVREPGEAEIVSIAGAELAPRGQILSGDIELPRNRPIIVHCKSGVRSAEVLNALVGQGFSNVRNLRGGILQWIVQVEPELPIY